MGNPNTVGSNLHTPGNSDPSLIRRIFGGNLIPGRSARRIGNFTLSAAQKSYEAEQRQKTAALAARMALRKEQLH